MKTKLLLLLLTVTTIGYSQFWTESASGFSAVSTGINQFEIVDASVIWATGYDGASATPANYQLFTKSTDGGSTWTPGIIDVNNSTLGISCLTAVDANTAWVGVFPNNASDRGGIFKTTDGGLNWAKQITAPFSDGASFTNVIHFWDANKGFCQGDPIGGYFELYTTNNGGTNWFRVPQANIPAPLSGEWGYTRQIETINNRVWFMTNKGRIYRSDDFGLNFTAYQSPVTDFNGASLSFFNENNGILAEDGTIYSTTDGGETWTLMTPSGTVKNGTVGCMPGTTIAISVSGDTTNAVEGSTYSLDGGLNWTDVDAIQHIGIEMEHGVTFSGGFSTDSTNGGVFKYTGTELSAGIYDNQVTLFNAYPNPVTAILNIKAIDTISKITVFNVLGQNIFEVTPNATTSKLNLASLASGSYTVKVMVKDTVQTMKFIK